MSAGGEVLSGAGFGVLRTGFQEGLIGVAVDIDSLEGPVLLVDVVLDQTLELGRVLEFVLFLAEDQTQCPRLVAKFFEQVPVGILMAASQSPLKKLGTTRYSALGRPMMTKCAKPFIAPAMSPDQHWTARSCPFSRDPCPRPVAG